MTRPEPPLLKNELEGGGRVWIDRVPQTVIRTAARVAEEKADG